MNADCTQAFNKLRFKKTRYVIFKIVNREVVVDKIAERKATWKDLKDDLDEFKPAYIGYDYEFTTKDGRAADKMYLIFYKPENTSQFDKISYSQALNNFKNNLPGTEYRDVETMDDIEDLLQEEVIDPTRL